MSPLDLGFCHSFWKILSYYFFEYFFCSGLFSPPIPVTCVLVHLILSQSSWMSWCVHFSLSISSCFRSGNVYGPIFEFMDSFLSCVRRLISLLKALLTSVTMLYISSISTSFCLHCFHLSTEITHLFLHDAHFFLLHI